jgi:lipopolysaccharide export system permease protein
VFGSILDRMILWELMKVFVMALLGITGILLMAGIVAEASQEGLGPAQILAAIPLLVPSTLPYTVPATTLFACCVVYGRLASDNEILAIKSSGVNILQVARPGLLLGLVASAVTLSIYWDVIPLSHRVLRQMVFNDAEELLYSTLRKQGKIDYANMPYAIWVRAVDGRKLVDPVIKGRNPQGKTNFVAEAKEAELHVDMPNRKLTFLMHFGSLTTLDGASNANFDAREVTVDLPPTFGSDGERRPRDMTWG